MTYKEVLAADTALAKKNIANMDPVTGAVVPPNLVPGKPVTFGADNVNVRKESTTAGNTGFDGVQQVVYQNGLGTVNTRIEYQEFCSNTLDVPASLTQPLEVNVPIVKQPPISSTNLETYNVTDSDIEDKPRAKNMAFNLARSNMTTDERHKNQMANWTAANQKLCDPQEPTNTEIGFMPLFHAPADDYSTLNTVFRRALFVADYYGTIHVIVVVDQALFCRAMELKWTFPEFQRLIFRLGGLHTEMNYQNTIGNHMQDSGIKEIWVKAGVIGPIKADKVLQGKSYKAAMRFHKLTYQALWRILVPQLLSFCKDHNRALYDTLSTLVSNAVQDSDLVNLISKCDTEEFRTMLSEFVELCTTRNKNFEYWWSYMEMVEVLLLHTRAQRTGDFDLCMHSFKRMLPDFFRYVILIFC